jgi:hypothetical protein
MQLVYSAPAAHTTSSNTVLRKKIFRPYVYVPYVCPEAGGLSLGPPRVPIPAQPFPSTRQTPPAGLLCPCNVPYYISYYLCQNIVLRKKFFRPYVYVQYVCPEAGGLSLGHPGVPIPAQPFPSTLQIPPASFLCPCCSDYLFEHCLEKEIFSTIRLRTAIRVAQRPEASL